MRVLTLTFAGLAAGQTTCSGTQKVTEACATTDCAYTPPCTPVDGEWSSWGEWGECECAALVQERMRSVSVESSCGGTPVSGSMHQSRGCDPDPTKCEVHDYKECKFSPWNPWSECKCGVLQIYRTRVLQQWSQDCGTPCDGPLKETEPCDQMQFADCVEPKDCTYAEWEPWSACSLTCGGGQKTAVRTIESEALHSGAGCNEPLTKTEPCEEACCPDHSPVDCALDSWTEWSQCTKTCETGSRTRSREVKAYPLNGGKLCGEEDLAEVEPCNEQPCKTVVKKDGEWDSWGEWSTCTVTCGGGYSSRERKMKSYAENGGVQPDGEFQEFKKCNEQGCESDAVDCEISTWSEWSSCSCACTGVRKSMREITQHAKNGGKVCEGGLSRVEACNLPGTPEGSACKESKVEACQWEEWSAWGECSASCLGGVQTRSRTFPGEIKDGQLPSVMTSAACTGPVMETQTCNPMQCYLLGTAVDCSWEEWSAWGDCSATCDGGQSQRLRDIKAHAQYGGAPCNAKDSVEVKTCKTEACAKPQFCIWSEWEKWSDCSATCGGGQRERVRSLEAVDDEPSSYLVDTKVMPDTTNLAQLNAHLAELRAGSQTKTALLGGVTVGAVLLAGLILRTSRQPQQFQQVSTE